MKCAFCGKELTDFDYSHVINEGLPEEKVVCESCFGNLWEENAIINCAGCGGWFEDDLIRAVGTVGYDTFVPCPGCGRDIVDGMTVEQREAEVIPMF